MPAHEFDKSTKWLLQHHGRGILRLGGVEDVFCCRALQAEVVQPRKLPDGILEVYRRGHSKSSLVVVEVSTYAEARIRKQALDALLLVYHVRGVLPDVINIVLRPKGRAATRGPLGLRSELGWS